MRFSPRCQPIWAGTFLVLSLLTAASAEPGFVPLFDGKTLQGWSAADMRYWSVRDGAITASSAGPVADHGYLVWQGGRPADFELKLKFRITGDAKANSGVQIRSQLRPDGYVVGYQADITRYEEHCAICYDETPGRGLLAGRGERTVIDEQGKRTVTRFADAGELWRQIKTDDWNDYHITARGQTLAASVNGRPMWEVTDRETARNGAAPGVIALQIHKGPPMAVSFKDIFLKDLSAGSAAAAAAFFPFCIDWHDAKKRSFEQQAEMLKDLGYPGVGHIWLDRVEERLATLDAAGLRLFQITMPVDLTPGKTPYDAARFKEVLARVKGRQVQFCLLVKGGRPSDPALDARAVEVFREMSDLAKDSGAQLLLYPHQKDWIERIEDSIRVAEKVDRPNVGVMFNLCHWLRVDPGRDYRPLLQRALPRLWAVSINGADERDDQPNWKRYIQPLDQGNFDVRALLKTLKELGYHGPIGLQCFGIGGDAREHLTRSMAKWRELHAQTAATPKLTLSDDKRPEWLRRDGIVMAGSWEPLLFRVRRDGAEGYTPTAEQRAAYEREHSPEMVAKLKALGVNFVMMHCYKGGGLEAERESMADAVKFAKLCHDAGMRVGCYTYSGAFIWELFYKEMPQAKDWVVLNPDGTPVTYGKAGYRYYWNRNHPDAEAFYRKIVRFAVEDMGTDLVHFDNYTVGPGHDANSIARFRQYLRATFPASLLKEHGIADVDAVMPPDPKGGSLLTRAWADFCSQSISDSFHSMTRYARTLRPDVLMETNPAGIGTSVRWAVDHGRLLRGGEAFWDEGRHPGFVKDMLTTRIRTFKAARGLNNSAFVYTINPLEAAESMAFNLDVLGCICWFEYDQLWEYPGNVRPMSPALAPFVKFYHQRHDLLRDAKVVADVAVYRSHPSMQFGPRETAKLTGEVEDLLIANRCAFQLVFDQQLDELARWPALVLPGCVALSDAQAQALRQYVAGGGRLCVIGPLATHDEWMLPRAKPALDDLPADRVVRVAANNDWLAAIRRACGGRLSLSVTCDSKALCAELTEQPNRRLVHLVNYSTESPMKDVTVRVALPKGRSAKSVTLASPEHAADITVPFKQEAGFTTFAVPAVGTYEIAVVNFQ